MAASFSSLFLNEASPAPRYSRRCWVPYRLLLNRLRILPPDAVGVGCAWLKALSQPLGATSVHATDHLGLPRDQAETALLKLYLHPQQLPTFLLPTVFLPKIIYAGIPTSGSAHRKHNQGQLVTEVGLESRLDLDLGIGCLVH